MIPHSHPSPSPPPPRSDVQLSGSTVADKQTLGDCTPWETWADHLPDNAHLFNLSGRDLSKLKLNPCGLIANSQFNGSGSGAFVFVFVRCVRNLPRLPMLRLGVTKTRR